MRRFIQIVFHCALWAALFATGLGNVMARHDANQKFGELRALESRRDELKIEWNSLRLSEGYLARYGRLEQTARTELGMEMPDVTDIAVIEP